MGVLTDDMKRVVREQRLGYIATVCPDGTPNLSPKATMKVWDDDHLVFADLASPGTIANLRQNSAIEINMVDHFIRKGYRFKGTAEVIGSGPEFDNVMTLFADRQAGVNAAIRNFVMIDRKSTRLNSSHKPISYAVFCLKKKKKAEKESDR